MAENKTQHTPLEWSQVYFPLLKERHIRYYGDGTAETLAVMNSGDSDTDKANAKYIVNCVNSHDRLVEALKEIRTALPQEIRINDSTFGYGIFIRDAHWKETYIDLINKVLAETENE